MHKTRSKTDNHYANAQFSIHIHKMFINSLARSEVSYTIFYY